MSEPASGDSQREPRPRRSVTALLGVLIVAIVAGVVVVVVVRRHHAASPRARAPVRPPPSASSAVAPPSAAPPVREYVDVDAKTLPEQREAMFTNMRRELDLGDAQLAAVRAIIEKSDWMGQGNPKVTQHPMTRAECRKIRADAGLSERDPDAERLCGARNMVPLYDPDAGDQPGDAKVCIDRYEFPDISCEYPVVWVQANEAASLCAAEGKRICDAGEWEGACAGRLLPPDQDYLWKEPRLQAEYYHNRDRTIVWSYGPEKHHELCATGSRKSKGCDAPTWQLCGTNSYPAGAFPKCVSRFGVYDLNGNAAEHMNMPLKPEELASRGGSGETEMKGSWFIFSRYEAHLDDCRWRAPMWHVSKLMARGSHRNYHLGFRCCKNR